MYLQDDEVPWKVMLSDNLWALRPNPKQFMNAVKEMLERCYPGFIPIKTQRPFVLCKVDRKLRRERLAEEAEKLKSIENRR